MKNWCHKSFNKFSEFYPKKNFFIDLLSLNAGYKNFKKTKYLKIINLDKKKQKNLRKNRLLYNLYSIFELIKLLKMIIKKQFCFQCKVI